jgi:hypothetical protein
MSELPGWKLVAQSLLLYDIGSSQGNKEYDWRLIG